MENKKIYITLFIISIIFLGIGGTLAVLTTSSTLLNISQIRSGNLTMTVDGGGSENVSLFPSTCTSEHAIKKTIKASAVNTSGGKVSFSIGMNVAVLSNDLKRGTMKYALSTSADSCTNGLIANGNFSNATVGSDIWIVKNDYDNITKSGNTYTKTYYLYIWLDKKETQNLSGSISVNMKGTSSNNPNLTTEAEMEKTLYDTIKANADTTTTIDFSKTSEASNTNGIYMTTNTDSGKPVYYYRGNVNNRVIFANFCWRIVRTTETGGVKLIYDGVPSEGQCNNTGSAAIIRNSMFNIPNQSPAYVGYMYGTVYTPSVQDLSALSGSIVFGNDITYANGTYTLKDTYTLTDVSNWSSEYNTIFSRYRYTCFTSSDTCVNVNFIENVGSKNSYYYELTGGKNHIDILREMLDNSTNENNSTIKTAIDTWYQNNMTNYTLQLEDATFCNDRSYDINKSNWDRNYADDKENSYLPYAAYTRLNTNKQPTLVCKNVNDKFTVEESNGNGALTYPVGLLTADEIMYAGAGTMGQSNESFYLYTSQQYWTLSPYVYSSTFAYEFAMLGGYLSGEVTAIRGIRPSVSLKPDTAISGGSGTATDPFIVE